MLYDLSTNQLMGIPEWAEDEMQQDFPEFFNGKPLKISVVPEAMISSMKVPSNDYNQSPRLFIEPPGDYSIKPKGIMFDKEDGYQMHVQYSESAVNTVQGTVNKITIRHGMTIQPHEKELLFYLQYLCPIVANNKAYRKTRNIFKFDKPEVEAKNKIEAAKNARQLENLIYFDIDYKLVLKTIDGLALSKKESEEENRVLLHDAIKNGSETFRKNAFEIINSSKPVQTKSSEGETIHELVNRLLSENFIKNEDGMWYIRDRRGDGTKWLKTPFFESEQTGSEAAFALIDHLKVNEELLGKLRKL